MNLYFMNAVAAHGARTQARRAARTAKTRAEDARLERLNGITYSEGAYLEGLYREAQGVLDFCTTQEIQAEKFFKKHRELLRENAPHLMNDLVAYTTLQNSERTNG